MALMDSPSRCSVRISFTSPLLSSVATSSRTTGCSGLFHPRTAGSGGWGALLRRSGEFTAGADSRASPCDQEYARNPAAPGGTGGDRAVWLHLPVGPGRPSEGEAGAGRDRHHRPLMRAHLLHPGWVLRRAGSSHHGAACGNPLADLTSWFSRGGRAAARGRRPRRSTPNAGPDSSPRLVRWLSCRHPLAAW
jgi:hypothetical protein